MEQNAWIKNFSGAVTVCDRDGIILEMNDKSIQSLTGEDGANLIGTNLMDCHSEESRNKLSEMFKYERRNVYTVEKNGVKKLIYQTPWYVDGIFSGFVELSLEIPFYMPHIIRGDSADGKVEE